ncbi:unnamed protein product [Meloidogyne enterolobii]|uniref:Uncharacterized protein n=1 Tax=Meloidogyne enterolobii TaxID=390850 RepID=A0ACB0ZYV4_MELEN
MAKKLMLCSFRITYYVPFTLPMFFSPNNSNTSRSLILYQSYIPTNLMFSLKSPLISRNFAN